MAKHQSPIQLRVLQHDRYQIEFKLSYRLAPEKRTRYRITTYIFAPPTLDINPSTYLQADFYSDVQTYIRVKTPEMSLRRIVKDPTSPLAVMNEILATPDWMRSVELTWQLVDSFKFLRAMLKTTLRSRLAKLRRKAAQWDEEKGADVASAKVTKQVQRLLDELSAITEKYREIGPQLNQPGVDHVAIQSYRLTDESISLLVEATLVECFRQTTRYVGEPARSQLTARICQLNDDEGYRRRSLGYHPLVLQKDSDNEEFLYWRSVLKKFTSSVLYLSTSVHREGGTLEQFLFAVAAGIAMAVATMLTFRYQQKYPQYTFALLFAFVIIYMIKDRLKEGSKFFFSRLLRNVLFDRRTVIRTMDGEHKLGYLREKVTIGDDSQVTPPVMVARNRSLVTEIDNAGLGETVIRYSKTVTLYRDAFDAPFAHGPDVTGIVDIMRYNVRPFLHKMANPSQRLTYLEAGKLHTVVAHRVYFLNFVIVTSSQSDPQQRSYQRVRVMLDRKGIQRVEILAE
jgi:hypothetical protein